VRKKEVSAEGQKRMDILAAGMARILPPAIKRIVYS
jgi:hypothetical protein